MGTTATSLHLLDNSAAPQSLVADIERAYKKLGYARPRKADIATPKRVILAGPGSGGFLSVHDSDNDAIDSGELKELAVDLSRRRKTVAILTSVLDSDSFEFIVWHNGKQVDAAVSDPRTHGGGLKMASGKRRAQLWADMFFQRDLRRSLAKGVAPILGQRERLETWQNGLREAQAEEPGPFAENAMMRWCDLAGIEAAAALAVTADAPSPGATTLQLLRTREPARKAAATATAPLLAFAREDDDLPYHRFYPAAWPVEPEARAQFRWFLSVAGPGFRGVRLKLGIEASGIAAGSPLRLTEAHMRALPFYNGQVTSMTPVASRNWPAADIGVPGRHEQLFEDAEFTVPAIDPQSRKAFVLILRVELALPAGGEAILRPSLEVLEPAMAGPELPPLRLSAARPAWQPVVSRPPMQHPAPQDEAVRCLNAPAARSMVAILPGDDGPPRAAIRDLAEAWLGRLAPPQGSVATVHTEKHMTASAHISKSTRSLPFAELQADRQWPKLFDPETDYQTVTVEIARAGAAYPLAGLVMQATLHGRGIGLGLRPAMLSGALWTIDHADVERELGLAADAAEALFEDWIAGVSPCQGWITRAAWIPAFDRYEDYMPTLYEQAATVEWHRLGLIDQLMDAARLRQRLRFVAPRLWLGAELAGAIDTARLGDVATVTRRGPTLMLTLRPEGSLADLEHALAPILPRTIPAASG